MSQGPNQSYVVSRQAYYSYEGALCVEIAEGGYDYTGADMLVERYTALGEGKLYWDPREAVKAALAIRAQWQHDEPSMDIQLSYGNTLGIFTNLEPGATEAQVRVWAETCYQKAMKCDYCGKIIQDDPWYRIDWEDTFFCCESHVDLAYVQFCKENGIDPDDEE